MTKRWTVKIEHFYIFSANRFIEKEYASLGMATDVRDKINSDAMRNGERVRATLQDNGVNRNSV